MVVLSIGLLGLSGMQTTSLRNNHSAFLRSQATVVTNDILDRIRANRDSATAGDYDIVYAATAPAPGCSGGSGCSVVDVANRNLAEWRSYVARLPEGEGEISVTAAGVVEVKVRWADTRDSANKLQIVTRSQI